MTFGYFGSKWSLISSIQYLMGNLLVHNEFNDQLHVELHPRQVNIKLPGLQACQTLSSQRPHVQLERHERHPGEIQSSNMISSSTEYFVAP